MLSAEVLEQLRLLTNLETNERKLLPSSPHRPARAANDARAAELEQLAERFVIARFHLNAPSAKETEHYIRHRLSVAGMTRAMPFDHQALQRIHELTRGVPRRMNLLCDRAMLGAYAHSRHNIDVPMIEKAGREVFGRATPATPDPARIRSGAGVALVVAAGLALAAAVGFALYAGWRLAALPTSSLAGAGAASAAAASASRALASAASKPSGSSSRGSSAMNPSGAAPTSRASMPNSSAPVLSTAAVAGAAAMAPLDAAALRARLATFAIDEKAASSGASCCRCGASRPTRASRVPPRRGDRCAARDSAPRCRWSRAWRGPASSGCATTPTASRPPSSSASTEPPRRFAPASRRSSCRPRRSPASGAASSRRHGACRRATSPRSPRAPPGRSSIASRRRSRASRASRRRPSARRWTPSCATRSAASRPRTGWSPTAGPDRRPSCSSTGPSASTNGRLAADATP